MNVNVKINGNCQLVAVPIDDSPIESLIDPCRIDSDATMFVDFILNPNINIDNTVKVSKGNDYYYYDLPEDGLYVYYRLKIFNKRYIDKDYLGLCYDPIKEILMFSGKPLSKMCDVVSCLGQGDVVIEYIKLPIFSICQLQNCLKELQKQDIQKCNNGLCNQYDSDKQMRDFLFISIYVLENLICEERYGEASDILESLTSCVPICKNITLTSGCNCR